jgi:hypothetical protein
MRGAEESVGRAPNAHTLRRGGQQQRLPFRMTGYQRLFRIDVLAGFDNLHADRRMGEWDGQVDDYLNIGIG